MNKRFAFAWGYITDSLMSAFADKGHETQRYTGDLAQWSSFDPDVYIGCSGHKEPIPIVRRAKVAIHVNPYGPIDLGQLNESNTDKEWVVSNKADLVFGYGSKNDAIIWSYWVSKLGIPWAPMPVAGDRLQYRDLGLWRHNDVVYLGGRWPYKAKTIDAYLLPVLDSYQHAIRGYGNWPSKYKVERLPEDQSNQFLNTGKIGPCISEAHTHQYGFDIPERAFKLALSGVLAIHDPVPSIKAMIPSMVVARDAQDYKNLVGRYLSNPDLAKDVARKQREEVLNNHTYHHRCATLLRGLGYHQEADGMIN
jgi:hypothetical protein